MCARKKIDQSILTIKNGNNKKVLSPLQQQFNKKVAQVEKTKEKVAFAREQIEALKPMLATHLQTIENELSASYLELVRALDRWYDTPKALTKKERVKIQEIIADHAWSLAEKGQKEAIPFFNKHSGEDFEEIMADEKANLKDMIMREAKEHMGVDLDLEDEAFENVEEFMAKMMGQLKEKSAEIDEFKNSSKQQKTKSEAEIKREEAQKEELKNISKTVKTVYNSLVKQYHPDRASDDEDILIRTKVMQQVTEAYENNDLFELLRLKLVLSNDTDADISSLPDEQLAFYNQILGEQLRDLQEEYYHLKHPMPPFDEYEEYLRARSIKGMEKKVKEEARMLAMQLEDIKQTTESLQEKTSLKNMLRGYRLKSDFPTMPMDFFSAMFDDDDIF